MRELKFRAWSVSTKKMYDRVLAGPGDPCSIVWDEKREEWLNFDDVCGEIMQFTGLLDTNGKEIYEGDIVEADEYLPLSSAWEKTQLIVTWNIERACWGCYRDGSGMLTANTSGFEVIGNMYERPELLQQH